MLRPALQSSSAQIAFQEKEIYRWPARESLKTMLVVGWTVERTKEGDTLAQQRENEKLRSMSQASQVQQRPMLSPEEPRGTWGNPPWGVRGADHWIGAMGVFWDLALAADVRMLVRKYRPPQRLHLCFPRATATALLPWTCPTWSSPKSSRSVSIPSEQCSLLSETSQVQDILPSRQFF